MTQMGELVDRGIFWFGSGNDRKTHERLWTRDRKKTIYSVTDYELIDRVRSARESKIYPGHDRRSSSPVPSRTDPRTYPELTALPL